MSISTMYMSDLNVATLARMHNISYRHLARLFVKITGYTLTEWLICTRLHFSMQMLVETDLPIAEIARQAGFSSESYFSSAFRASSASPPGRTGGKFGAALRAAADGAAGQGGAKG